MGTCLSTLGLGPAVKDNNIKAGVGKDEDDIMIEEVVCKEDELEEGVPKEVKLGPEKRPCLLIRQEGGRVNALSAKCTHYGANLAKGSYADGKIRCPWHGACFDVATGDIEDFPGLDGLNKYVS